MGRVILVCDRCKRLVTGTKTEHATGGFYWVQEGYWTRFANPGECVVCDECMWRDERYLTEYPHTRGYGDGSAASGGRYAES